MRWIGLSLLLASLALVCGGCGEDPSVSDAKIEIPSWAKVAPEQVAEAKKHGVPVAFENDLGMRFVLIPAGTFLMGSPEDEEDRNEDETQHEVTISQPFYMQITEVTNGQYSSYKPDHLPILRDKCPDRADITSAPLLGGASQPVCEVRRMEVEAFVEWLSRGEGSAARAYRLPFEEEWEYGCRAGSVTPYFFGDDRRELTSYANVAESPVRFSPEDRVGGDGHDVTAPVGSYFPNQWGLYDMLGNVWELCQWAYEDEPDEPWAVRRGGGWGLLSGYRVRQDARCAVRDTSPYDFSPRMDTGFRLVSPLPAKAQ